MNAMDVSVVIPVYNAEETIAMLLKALAEQETLLRYEVIVVDNESTDKTRRIIDDVSGGFPIPLTIKMLSRGATIAKVRNHGASYASGAALAFIDSDCEPPKSWVQKGFDLLMEHSMAALIAGGCRPPKDDNWLQRAWQSTRAGHKEGAFFVHGANFFIPKEVFQDLNGFRDDMETSEDYDLGCRVSRKYKVVPVPQFTVTHYGDVDTLIKKIKKERWYGKNAMKLLRTNLLYKPFWLSAFFLASCVCLLISLMTHQFLIAISMFTAIFMVTFLLALYFCKRADNYTYLISMVPISFAYLLGRSLGIIDNVFSTLASRFTDNIQ
jgi:glycosyltransferase involved in cell wall biosynthesis